MLYVALGSSIVQGEKHSLRASQSGVTFHLMFWQARSRNDAESLGSRKAIKLK